MPLPKPRKGETKKAFLGRCMADTAMVSEFNDRKQRYAVCNDQWTNKKTMTGDEQQTFSRHFSIRYDRDAAAAGEGVVDIAISSETDQVERWFGAEVLAHDKRAVNLKRIRDVGGWLVNHDPSQIVGAIVNPRVDEDAVLRAGIRFDDTDTGNRAKTQVESGSLKGASVNYSYGADDYDEVPEGESKDFNGRSVKGPARIVNKWMPIEFTLTPIPADAGVGVGRSNKSTKRGMAMRAKYEVVGADGLRIWRGDADGNPFATKRAAEAFSAAQEDECEVRKLEVTKDGDKSDETPRTRDDKELVDIEQLKREMGKTHAERITAIMDAAEVAAMPDFGREMINEDPDIDLAEAQRQIHKRWASDKTKKNRPKGNPEPPATSGKRFKDMEDDDVVANVKRRTFNDALGDVETGVLRISDWRNIVSEAGPHLQRRLNGLFESDKLDPNDISFKAVYEGLRGLPSNIPCFVRDDIVGDTRAVQSTAFAIIAGSTVIAAVRKGYENVATVADKLVDSYESSAATDSIPAILTDQKMQEVAEGQAYIEGGATEEYVTIGSRKQGRILSLTREMIARDQTGMFVRAANRLGEKAQTKIEQLVVQRVSDSENASGIYVYRPSGTGEALYSTTARTRGTNKVATNGLVDHTDLDNARALLAAMTDNEGDRINARGAVLFVPDALVGTAQKIIGSEMTPGTENELNPWGPRGMWRPELISTPFLDDESTSSWYLGEPKKQFWMKKAFGIETTMQGRDSDAWFTNDIAMRFRVAFDVEVGAVDYVYFVQSTA